MNTKRLTIGTRKSNLAMWQSNYVADAIQAACPDVVCELRPFTTQGDRTQSQGIPLPKIGGKGLFTQELEAALRNGEIDLAVHSLKDLPVEDAPGLIIGAITQRAAVTDAIVAHSHRGLMALPAGAIVGTGSRRRAALLLAVRPDLKVESIRGNVETRLRKVLEEKLYDATLLAVAGLERLGLQDHITQELPVELMLPAPGQGALGIQCRADDESTLDCLKLIDHAATRQAVTAERVFLHALEGGCSAPVGALATAKYGSVQLDGIVALPDGSKVIRVSLGGRDPFAVGEALAADARLQGAADMIKAAGDA